MKTSIYYFTGTGNSLYAAQKLNDFIDESSLFSIVKALNENDLTIDADVVGIVIPLYYGGLPELVVKFLENINIKKDTYVFAVATRGGTTGHVMVQIDELLKKKGLILHRGFFLTMPANYVRMYDMKSSDKIEKIIRDADDKLKVISECVEGKETCAINNSLMGYITQRLYKNFLRKLETIDNKFKVDDKCNGCLTCENVCPENNIKVEQGRPIWNHHCQDCMACIQLCPQRSIQLGGKTIKRGRYKNPYISITDIINQK